MKEERLWKDEERIQFHRTFSMSRSFQSASCGDCSSCEVYHFQELSRTSIRDAIFERDGRYIQLKKDLSEEVNKLSPAQFLRFAMRERQTIT